MRAADFRDEIQQGANALLQIAGRPFLGVADGVALLAAENLPFHERPVGIPAQQALLDIRLPEGRVFIGVIGADVQAHVGIVGTRLRDQHPQGHCRVFGPRRLALVADLVPGRIAGIVAVVIPAHEIDDLVEPARKGMGPLDDLQRLVHRGPYVRIALLLEEDLVDERLVVVVVPAVIPHLPGIRVRDTRRPGPVHGSTRRQTERKGQAHAENSHSSTFQNSILSKISRLFTSIADSRGKTNPHHRGGLPRKPPYGICGRIAPLNETIPSSLPPFSRPVA